MYDIWWFQYIVICIISFDFFFIALNQTLPMFTKSICNKNISVILSLHEFHYERNRGEWWIFKIINFSKKQLFRINEEIKINRSAHIYIFYDKKTRLYYSFYYYTEKKVKKPKSSK